MLINAIFQHQTDLSISMLFRQGNKEQPQDLAFLTENAKYQSQKINICAQNSFKNLLWLIRKRRETELPQKEEDEIDKYEKSIDFMLSQTLSTVVRTVRFELKQKQID